jgi:hypothetical protein
LKAMNEGVAGFYDALLDKSWIPWQTKRPRCPPMLLVLHVEMRYGERCLNISHDARCCECVANVLLMCYEWLSSLNISPESLTRRQQVRGSGAQDARTRPGVANVLLMCC